MKTHMCNYISIVMFLALPISAQVSTAPSINSPVQAEPQLPYGAPVSSTNAMRVRFLAAQEAEPMVFIIPAADGEEQDLAPIREDLPVMCRIFDKMHSTGMGNLPVLGILFRPENENQQRTEALYLQGYGVVFFVKVPFTLDFSKSEGKTETEDRPGIDPVWQSVKEETLYGHRRNSNAKDTEQTSAMNRAATLLTTERLLRTLKHASNIRALAPDEKIIVRITGEGKSDGSSGRSNGRGSTGYRSMGPYGGGGNTPYGGDPFSAQASSGDTTTLIARTTKADVDDYSHGKLTFEQFSNKANVIGLDGNNMIPVAVSPR